MTHEELVRIAALARARAVAPRSGFRVGAALLAGSGRVFEGCNIENQTLNLGLCAERVALAAALAAGERQFEALALAAKCERPATPCGACRQLLWEFAGDIPVISDNLSGRVETFSLARLMPNPFEGAFRPGDEGGVNK
jgi:cytidine deaminase